MSPDRWRLVNCVIVLFFLVGFTLVNVTDGWKLRDLSHRATDNDSANLTTRKPEFRDLPMSRIVRIVKDDDNSNDDSDNDDTDDNDDDDEDDDDDDNLKKIKSSKKVVFEKVHSTHFDLPKKPLGKQNDDENEDNDNHNDNDNDSDNDDDNDEKPEITNQESSFFDPILNLFSGFTFSTAKEQTVEDNHGENDDQKNEESSGFLNWLSSFRKAENSELNAKRAETPEKNLSDEESSPTSWISYLDRKPFNYVLDYFYSKDEENLNGDNDDTGSNDDETENDKSSSDEQKQESSARQAMTAHNFEELLLNIPSFIPNYTKIDNIDCKRMGQIFVRQVRGQKLWALQMMDASAKIPSGFLRGNANQLGDFDLCTEIRTKVKLKEDKSIKIKGKYCLANIDIVASDDELRLPVHLLQGRNFLRSRLDDPSHFLPRFSTLKWGICLPNACSNNDAEHILNEFLTPFNTTGIKLLVEIEKDNCFVRKRNDWPNMFKDNWKMTVTVGYFTFFLVVTVVASLNDYWRKLKLDILFADSVKPDNDKATDENDGQNSVEEAATEVEHGFINKMLMAFSVKNTGPMLFNFDDGNNNEETIYCIYGLKGLATIFLFFSFKFLTIGHLPFTNRAHLTELMNSPFSIFFRASILYMDIFLLASGFFAGYSLSKDIQIRYRIPWARRYLGRFIRLAPSFIATILFTSWIMPHIDNGPQWGQLITQNAELCQENFWKNIFFVQNWFSFKEQCAPQLGQLAIDVQLFIIAPIIITSLHRNVSVGFGIFGVLTAFSTAIRYSQTLNQRLSFVIFHGMKLSQFYRTLSLSYSSALQRGTPYFIGLGLGMMLFQSGRNVRLPKVYLISGWIMSIGAIGWCYWSVSDLALKDYAYQPIEAAQYAAWAPLIWSLAISWIIFVVFTRNDGILSKLLTIKPLIFISRLSYQIFFIQFLVLFYVAATAKTGESFNLWTFIDSFEIVLVIGLSTITAMLFDLPVQTISKMIVARGIDEDVAAEEERQKAKEKEEEGSAQNKEEEEKDDNLKTPTGEDTIDSVWGNDEEKVEEPFVIQGRMSFSTRSYSPVWKRDEEEHKWGDDDEDDKDTVVINHDDLHSKKDEQEEEEESEESEEQEEDEEISEKSSNSVRRRI